MRSAVVSLVSIAYAVALLCCGSDEQTAPSGPPTAAGPGEAEATVAAARATFGTAVKPGATDLAMGEGAVTPTWHPAQQRSVDVTLPSRANGRWSVRDRASRLSMEVSLVGAADQPASIAGGWAVFRHALDGADMLHRPHPHGTEDLIVLARRPAEPMVAYDVSLGPGVAGLRKVADVVELLDAGGAPRLRIAAPDLVDARRQRHPLRLEVAGCYVDERPAPPWGRTPTPPGAASCRLRVRWDDAGVIYPAMVDPVWTNAAALAFAHSRHTATKLDDGRVLVAGGVNQQLNPTADAEVFDPDTGTWAMVDPLPTERTSHSATLITEPSALENHVLVVGGAVGVPGSTTATCVSFDPSLGTWSPAAALAQARALHATAVTGSKVLVAGGTGGGAVPLASAELFDPLAGVAGIWSTVGSLATQRVGSSALPLDDDRVLVAGGVHAPGQATATAEIFNPTDETFGAAGTMSTARAYFQLVSLEESPDGPVLAAGGLSSFINGNFIVTATSDVFNPDDSSWTSGPPMSANRYQFTLTRLQGGSLLAAGGRQGYESTTIVDSAELLGADLQPGWVPTDSMLQPRAHHSASLLEDGTVLVVGGEAALGLTSVQRYGGLPDGEACIRATECTSGICAVGICCDAPCDGVCESCEAAIKGSGDDGACGPIAAGTDPRNECLDDGSPSCQQNGQCDGAGACQQYPSSDGCSPEPCRSGDECASGSCVDGICCDGECEGECASCLGAYTGNVDGQCAPIVKGTDPDDECSDGADGNTDCSTIFLCDGAGSCMASEEVCGPYSCLDASGCNSSCTDDADCAATHRCDGGACVPRAAGCDGTALVGADGSTEDCSPYICDVSGPACKESCESAADCAPGFVCNGDGSCVANPTAPPSDDGCGCRFPGGESDHEDSRGALLLLAALAAVARPRRCRLRA